MKYYLLKTVSDPSVVGAWPQLQGFQVDLPYNRNYTHHHKTHLPDELEMGLFKMDDKATATDLLSAEYLGFSGFFMNRRLQTILSDFSVPDSKFYQSIYYQDDSPHEIVFLQLLESTSVDFPVSTYKARGRSDIEVKAEDLDSLRARQSELNRQPRRPRLIPDKLKLQSGPDLLKVPLTIDFIISERLKEKLEAEGVSGYRVRAIRQYEVE